MRAHAAVLEALSSSTMFGKSAGEERLALTGHRGISWYSFEVQSVADSNFTHFSLIYVTWGFEDGFYESHSKSHECVLVASRGGARRALIWPS